MSNCTGCFNTENLRDELIENCGKQINVVLCSDGTAITFQGQVIKVGTDFVELISSGLLAQEVIIIPLHKIKAFVEVSAGIVECQVDCGTNDLFVCELGRFCGQSITVFWNACGDPVSTGILSSIGAGFIILRNVAPTPYGLPGGTQVILLSEIIAVEIVLVP